MRAQSHLIRSIVVLGLAAVLGGCASTGSSSVRSRSDVLTREEIMSVPVGNLYEVIQRLRPRWLSVRSSGVGALSTTIAVYQDQVRLGDLEILRQISPQGVKSIRYLDRSTAQMSLPGNWTPGTVGAIVITMRKET